MDLTQKTIQDLFYRQISKLTQKSARYDSLDVQFSDKWL